MLLRRVRAARRFSTKAVAPAAEENGGTLSLPATSRRRPGDSLGRRLFSLAYRKRSAVTAIQLWREEGNTVRKYELTCIVKELRKVNRHKQALEICEWMTQQSDIKLLQGDYAVQLDLIAKLHGLANAEKFFEDLPDEMKGNATYTALLHSYVQNKETSKAEALFMKMSSSNFLNCPLPYNRMMALYISTGQLWKLPKMVQELKKNTLPNIVTYNMFLSVCASRDDVDGAEDIFRELRRSALKPDLVTYSALTNLYIRSSLHKKAALTLKEMEKMVTRRDRAAFSTLLTFYTSMEDKDQVQRIWKKMKECFHKMTSVEYICIISSLVKLDEFEEAENLYAEWESISKTDDSRVSNILLAAYINKKGIEKAEKFYNRMVEKGIITPNYSTYELLTWAYLKDMQMEKALHCFKKAISSVRKWVFDNELVTQMFTRLEGSGDVEGAEQLLSTLREAGYVSTEIYKLLLKTYARAGELPRDVAEDMEDDNVEVDEEVLELIRAPTTGLLSRSIGQPIEATSQSDCTVKQEAQSSPLQ